MRIAIVCLALLGLAGCAWLAPTGVPRGTLQFEQGVTTESQIAGRLGQPNVTTWMPDGTKVEVYTFLPAAGGQPDVLPARSKVLTITFDRTGRLLSFSSTGG